MSQGLRKGHTSPDEVIRIFAHSVEVWRRLEVAFPIREHYRHQIIVSSSTIGEEELALQSQEYWNRLVLAANLRKFLNQKEEIYLPRVLEAFIRLGRIDADNSDVVALRDQIEKMHSGESQIGMYQVDNGPSLSAWQVVEALLHGAFLHWNSRKHASIEGLGEGLTRQALWEWIASYRPILNLLAEHLDGPQVAST